MKDYLKYTLLPSFIGSLVGVGLIKFFAWSLVTWHEAAIYAGMGFVLVLFLNFTFRYLAGE